MVRCVQLLADCTGQGMHVTYLVWVLGQGCRGLWFGALVARVVLVVGCSACGFVLLLVHNHTQPHDESRASTSVISEAPVLVFCRASFHRASFPLVACKFKGIRVWRAQLPVLVCAGHLSC